MSNNKYTKVFSCISCISWLLLGEGAGGTRQRAELARAGMIVFQSFLQIAFVEVRPQARAEI